MGSTNLNEKIIKLEQCFDEVTIALIGLQIVSTIYLRIGGKFKLYIKYLIFISVSKCVSKWC